MKPEPQPLCERPLVIARVPLARASCAPSAAPAHGPRGVEAVAEAVRALASGFFSVAAAAVAPPRCAGCGWFCEHLFCASCAPRVRQVGEECVALCECCGEPLGAGAEVPLAALCADCRVPAGGFEPPIERARSLWMLSGPVRHAVHDLKYLGHTDLAPSLGAHMGAFARLDAVLAGASVVVPVPLHPRREWKRGFNQSALLARHVASEMRLPYAEMLRRVRHTPTQTSLSRPQRDANVRAAFEVRPELARKYLEARCEGAQALLVDDVWTTGATLRECARSLHEAGFSRVCALTLARRGQ